MLPQFDHEYSLGDFLLGSCFRWGRTLQSPTVDETGWRLVTADSQHAYPVAPNLVARQSDVEKPDQVWGCFTTVSGNIHIWAMSVPMNPRTPPKLLNCMSVFT